MDIASIIQDTRAGMEKSIAHLESELQKIRAGRPGPHLVDNIMVDYYGTPTPITQVANCSATDAKTLAIQPWEKPMLGEIEKAILQANIGLTPMSDGEVVRLVLPPMTEERRKDLVKQAKVASEDSKIGIRQVRQDAMNDVKKIQKEGVSEDEAKSAEKDIQDITNEYVSKTEKLLSAKEEAILSL